MATSALDPTVITPPITSDTGDESSVDFHALGSTRVFQSADRANRLEHAEQTSAPHDTLASPAEKPKEISVLGGYQLLKRIGQGAMGEVYKARDLSQDRLVALKVLFPHVAGNPKLVERLNREGRVMGQLDHPNLVSAYGIGEDQGWHFVAMEYVEGESLQAWIDRLKRLSLGDSVAIAIAAARALEYAHGLNLVHRDIKPENVLITETGEIKVTDLGMVKTPDEDMSLTQTGHAVGTPWYMPLEQARNAKDTDGRCDIYALGCMLYCMITGRPPFMGRTLVDVIQAKESGVFPPARQCNPRVPERLDLILVKMTAKLSRYRYANCTELLADLESLGLANERLSFIGQRTEQAAFDDGSDSGLSDSSSWNDFTDEWYLRVLQPDGTIAVRKLATAQLKKMLEEGTVVPTAIVSRHPDVGFRTLATFREFQATALLKQSRRVADQSSARYRNLYRKIEERDKNRDPGDKSDKRADESSPHASRLWIPAVIIAGSIVLSVLLWQLLINLR